MDGVERDPAAFVAYYARQSLTPAARQRSQRIYRLVTEALARPGAVLDVADIGCGPGAQSMVWALAGHRVHALDVNHELLDLAQRRATEAGLVIRFHAGSARALPFADGSMDVCLAPELLEHVPEWRASLREFARILRPGGVLYLSTTNRLCPRQQEYTLPLYSWYPGTLKRRYERLAVTTHPDLVNHATFPALHWFTFYQLRDFLRREGMEARDRFELIDPQPLSPPARLALNLVRRLPPLRWLGQVATPYTVLLARRIEAP